MLMGMFITQDGLCHLVVHPFWCLHIGVGFCVARSSKSGNAKASECGTSNSTDSYAFFILKLKLLYWLLPGIQQPQNTLKPTTL
jgi:hypothetical protein